MKSINFIKTEKSITAVIDGKPYIMENSHPSFKLVLKALRANNQKLASSYFDIGETIKKFTDNKVKIINGELFFNQEKIVNSVVNRIKDYIKEGLNHKPLIKFLEKLLINSRPHVREGLFNFLESNNIPITENGNFLGYKSVRGDYKDWHSGTFDNSIGKLIEDQSIKNLDEKGLSPCGLGYHIGSYNYAKGFHSSNEQRIMICEVNPEHVINVPLREEKLRTWRYKVVDEMISKEVPLSKPKYSVKKEGVGLKNYRLPKRDKNGRFIKQ